QVRILPWLRGQLVSRDAQRSAPARMIATVQDDPAILRFVNSADARRLAELGTSCPDHFLRTKIKPLYVAWDPATGDLDTLKGLLKDGLTKYRAGYAAYYERCKHPDSPPMRDPNPVVYLVPGIGMITFARDKATARIAGEFYRNAINVMRGASAVDTYVGLPEQEAFDIEYWLLEEAKLQRMPRPKSLAGRTALVTGGAGGIGSAIARRYLGEGAAVVIADIDRSALDGMVAALAKSYGRDNVRGVLADVTDEDAVARAFADAAVEFGGLDILVSNAGISSS